MELKHYSDCALHKASAYPVCDCGGYFFWWEKVLILGIAIPLYAMMGAGLGWVIPTLFGADEMVRPMVTVMAAACGLWVPLVMLGEALEKSSGRAHG